ncbi:hypothetical protein [Leminorella grimontii]|uniref:hypothetical protein n=1 Tax=Leminorella grimontii TaxID=82981 RepID=UPI00321FC5A2
MSLESALERNTQAIEAHSALLAKWLEQQQTGSVETTFKVPALEDITDAETISARKGPFYVRHSDGKVIELNTEGALEEQLASGAVEIHKIEYMQLQRDAEERAKQPDIEKLDLDTITALAVLFGDKAQHLTSDMLADAEKALAATSPLDTAVDMDALRMALSGVPSFKALYKSIQLQICCQLCQHWEALPDITSRREYAEAVLKADASERPNIKPKKSKTVKTEPTQDTASSADEATPPANEAESPRKTVERLILQLARGGYRSEAVAILDKFGVKKVSEAPDDLMPEIARLAEAALGGENV